jgi:hypothetical protein
MVVHKQAYEEAEEKFLGVRRAIERSTKGRQVVARLEETSFLSACCFRRLCTSAKRVFASERAEARFCTTLFAAGMSEPGLLAGFLR